LGLALVSCWCPSPFPLPSISRCFSIHSSSPAIWFHSSIFHGGGICIHCLLNLVTHNDMRLCFTLIRCSVILCFVLLLCFFLYDSIKMWNVKKCKYVSLHILWIFSRMLDLSLCQNSLPKACTISFSTSLRISSPGFRFLLFLGKQRPWGHACIMNVFLLTNLLRHPSQRFQSFRTIMEQSPYNLHPAAIQDGINMVLISRFDMLCAQGHWVGSNRPLELCH